MNKLAIIGKGTTGSLASMWYLYNYQGEIDWYYDPNIPPMSVGEGTQLGVPRMLWDTVGFTFYDDLPTINGSIKTGIRKVNWGGCGDYQHPFIPPEVAMHFDAGQMQKFAIERLGNQVNLIEGNVTPDSVDATHVLDCTGTPKDFDEYTIAKHIPLNAVHVTQCFWDSPTFDYTYTIARPYGWVFGIPLQHRCSIGYLYNKDINTLEEVKEDVKEIFEQIGLTPSDTTNSFEFTNYFKNEPFGERVATSGNKCFFLEPLEATSFTTSLETFTGALSVWQNPHHIQHHTKAFHDYMIRTEQMIMMHYFAGSKFDTKFWDFAQERAEQSMREALSDKFMRGIIRALDTNEDLNEQSWPGGWSFDSYRSNIQNLGIEKELKRLYNETALGQHSYWK